jgi:hypothetical protein
VIPGFYFIYTPESLPEQTGRLIFFFTSICSQYALSIPLFFSAGPKIKNHTNATVSSNLLSALKTTDMKKNKQLPSLQTFIIAGIILLFSACSKDTAPGKKTYTYTIYTPVYQSKATVLAGINGNAAEPIKHAGKIYIKENFIYLNDVNKGIHIFDNSNPSRPVQIAFLAIPGNLDIAVKENTLYADMYGDLVTLDITNPRNAKITKTLPEFFSGRVYVNGYAAMQDDQIAAEWKERDTTVLTDPSSFPRGCDFCQMDMNGQALASAAKGTAGSMAGMVLMNDHLYAISEMHSVKIADISNAASPEITNEFFAGFDLQTIFPFENKLFLGSAVGMFMYDVSDPNQPVSLGEFTHGRACDPVITDGSYAYVTLHAGDGCGSDVNELQVIDVKDLQHSKLAKTYQLTKPTGLSKEGKLLFICDGTAVKIFNASNPERLVLQRQIKSNEPYDVIVSGKRAMIVSSDGLHQYDYSNINNIRLLSFLPVKK